MPKTLVLGLGNLLLSDEGFGVQAIGRLRARWRFDDDVEVMDGGTLGLGLLPALEDADRILVLDVVEVGATPGTLVRLSWNDLPRALRVKVSPHQETLEEALALLELRRGRPEAFEVVGVQPRSLAWGVVLSAPVKAALEPALAEVIRILARWGHHGKPRGESATAVGEPPSPH